MLCVTTPGDPITARAKMDFMKMEKHAKVTIQIRRIKISCIDVKRYFVGLGVLDKEQVIQLTAMNGGSLLWRQYILLSRESKKGH